MRAAGIHGCTVALILCLTACLSPACWSADAGLPMYSAIKAASPPVIDGILDDACWLSAEKTPAFVSVDGGPAKVETRGIVCYGRDRLYIAIDCTEPEMATLKTNLRSGLMGPWDESIELFLDVNADQRDYMQLRVGILGDKDTATTDIVGALALNPRWDGKVHLGEDGWTVEASIPFSVLGGRADTKAYWGLNLCRSRSVGTGGWLCWSATRGWFHTPTRFGRLIFAPYSEWLQDYFTNQMTDRRSQMIALAKTYPTAVGSVARELDSARNAQAGFLNEVTKANPQSSSECRTFADKGEIALGQIDQLLSSVRLKVIEAQFGSGK